jgi:PTS system nitrogen regulatory IIA component
MDLADLINPDRVVVGLRANDKAQLLQDLSRRAAGLLGMSPQPIIAALQAREQLGSTGLGRGFALPHARVEGVTAFLGLFARLSRPIEFQAIDEKPVDLVFLLLIPPNAGNEHVAALAAISRPLRDQAFVARVRKADTAAALYALLAGM